MNIQHDFKLISPKEMETILSRYLEQGISNDDLTMLTTSDNMVCVDRGNETIAFCPACGIPDRVVNKLPQHALSLLGFATWLPYFKSVVFTRMLEDGVNFTELKKEIAAMQSHCLSL